jgi:hypothetical protein
MACAQSLVPAAKGSEAYTAVRQQHGAFLSAGETCDICDHKTFN